MAVQLGLATPTATTSPTTSTDHIESTREAIPAAEQTLNDLAALAQD